LCPPKLFFNPSRANYAQCPNPQIIGPGPTIGPILNLKTVLRRYCHSLQNWYRLL
jgi:hypothetical protein